jgi:hypothetical protein
MFIIPFTHTIKKEKNIIIHIIRLLCVGGKDLWEEFETENISRDILEPNSLFCTATPFIKFKGQNIFICEIDDKQTNMSDFYNWDEISLDDQESFCWKKIIHITDMDKKTWLPIPETEKMSNFKVKDIINAILTNSKNV